MIDPRGVAPAALYLAAKVEETLLQARYLFQLMQKLAGERLLTNQTCWLKHQGLERYTILCFPRGAAARCVMRYCSTVWPPWTKTDLNGDCVSAAEMRVPSFTPMQRCQSR